MSPADPDAPPPSPRIDALTVLMLVLACIGLALTVLLTLRGFNVATALPGCGGNSGCNDVLASPWAKIGAAPVALPACGVYATVLLGLWLNRGSGARQRTGRRALGFASVALIGGALWFIGLQLKLGSVCVWCMATHVISLTLGTLILLRGFVNPQGLIAGAIALATLIGFQVSSAQQPPPRNVAPTDRDTDQRTDDGRVVTVIDGALTFTLQAEPYRGDPEAEHVVVAFFDYLCPHCRDMHAMLKQAMAEQPERYVLVSLPISLHPACAGPITTDNDRFDQSCQLAELALHVAATDRRAWLALDDWLFEQQPTAAEAHAYVQQTLGLTLDFETQRDTVRETMQRNHAALAATQLTRLPVVVTPGQPAQQGEVESLDQLNPHLGLN